VEFLIFVLAFVLLDIVAICFGRDSRDGRANW
jgi:hypothetical protein